MNVHVIPAGPIGTNAYLLTQPVRNEAVLIDAPGGIWPMIQPLLARENLRLTELWLTHGHWDHMQGAAEVVRACGALVRAHPADRLLIEKPAVQVPFAMPGMEFEPVSVTTWLTSGEWIEALGVKFEVRHVPGHCPGNVLFYSPEAGAAYVGDAIFAGSIGRTDLVGGDFATLERSIREQIYTLPASTVLHPGHGPCTTVAEEKANNPYVPALS